MLDNIKNVLAAADRLRHLLDRTGIVNGKVSGCVWAALGLFTCAAWGQSTFGSLIGTVTDPSGGTVSTCIVTVTNKDTSSQRRTVTDRNGTYSLVNLEPGKYQIEIQAAGFERALYPSIEVQARQTVRIDASVTLATQTQAVTVTEAPETVINTDVSSIAETKTGKELNDLPIALGSRAAGSTSPISTLTTQPGVQTDATGNLSVAGSKPSMLSVSVDGISSVSPRNSAPLSELFPSFGAIAEIRVSEINNTAEYGGVSDITTTSRGGSNAFHGGIFENLQNTAFNARNLFSATKPKLNMNDFGAFVGGPVSLPKLYHGRDRTFFFMSYEGLRLPRESVITQSVPSLALRSGDLSVYSTRTIKDPTTGLAFPGNRIPLNRISPISLRALDLLFPLPNTGAPNAISNNFTTNLPTPITSNQGDVRLDQNITSRQTAFARFTYKRRDVSNTPTYSVLAGATRVPENDFGLTAAHNFVITPNLVNEVRAGFNGMHSSTFNSSVAKNLISSLGFTGIPDPPDGSGSPTFNISGFTRGAFTTSSISRANTIQALDNLTWIKGRHTLKFGGDYRYMTAYFSNVFATSRAGSYTFNGSVTNSSIGSPYAAFLLGVPDISALATVKAPDTSSFGRAYATYAQDDWKPTSRLTINFGLRWEYHPAFQDKLNNVANFLPDVQTVVNGTTVKGAVVIPDKASGYINPDFAAAIAPTPILTASQAGLPQSLHYSKKTDFAPRVGFAYRPFGNDKTVIRGGYGRYIETLLSALITAGWAVEASSVGSYTQTLVNGKPTLTFPYAFPSNLSQPGTATFEYASDVHYRDPYVDQWNLTVERDLGFGTSLRVSYDGNHGSQLGYSANANQIRTNTIGFAAARSAAPFPIWAHITDYLNGARSNYNAGTVAVNKRFSKGVQFLGSYAFAKNLSNGAGYNPTAFTGEAGGMVSDPYNINLDYGNVAYTRRHRFLATFLYDLPFGQNHLFFNNANRLTQQLIGGWQLSGVVLAQTGPFLTVLSSGADPGGTNFPNLESSVVRADSVSGVALYPANQTVSSWISPAAFAVPQNNIGRFGNSAVGSVVGPGTQAVSLSLFKSVSVTERLHLQIGAAASNLFNHPNYAAPALDVNTPASFGTISSLQSQENGGPRSLQLTARISF